MPWEPYPGAKGGFELISKVRLPVERAEFTGTVKGKSDYKKVQNMKRGSGEVRVHGGLSRMHSSEQRNVRSEPFGGV